MKKTTAIIALLALACACFSDNKGVDKVSLEVINRMTVEDQDGALNVIEDGIKKYPQSIQMYWLRAGMTKLKDTKSSNDDLNRALALPTPDAIALSSKASVYLALKDRESALKTWEQIIKTTPKTAHDYMAAAIAQKGLGNLDAALEAANKAVELAPGTYRPYVERIGVLGAQEKFEEALADAESVIKVIPDSPLGYTIAGGLSFKLGKYAKAAEFFERASKKYPEAENLKRMVHVAKGMAAQQEGQDE